MNAFDLNRKEYIRVNNNGGDPLTNFNKVTFLTSNIVIGNSAFPFPIDGDLVATEKANYNVLLNSEQLCDAKYSDASGFACYITEMSTIVTKDGPIIPTVKINVYAMDGRDITA
jgi:hypothetical protein